MDAIKMAILMSRPIKDLRISSQTYYCLKRHNIDSIVDIYMWHLDEDNWRTKPYGLFKMYLFGSAKMCDLNTALKSIGLPTMKEAEESFGLVKNG